MEDMYGIKLYHMARQLIDKNFKMYFNCSHLVDEICAIIYDVSLSDILNARKRLRDPYLETRTTLRHRLLSILNGMKKEGQIEKYSTYTWKKVAVSG